MKTPSNRIAPAELTLDGVVDFYSKTTPHSLALEFAGAQAISWAQFTTLIDNYAAALKKHISEQQIIGVLCEDTFEFHAFINAIWKCGFTVMLISRTWGSAMISDRLTTIGVDMVYYNQSITPKPLNSIWRPFPLPSPSSHPTFSRSKLDDVALIASTSGTTDMPKSVRITHRQIRAAYRNGLECHNFDQVKTTASLFPLNGIGVLGICFLFPREVGAATRVYPHFNIQNINNSWSHILNHDTDFVYLVPPIVRLLNILPKQQGTKRKILAFCAAAPIKAQELLRLEEKFPIRIYNCYGLTEMTFAVFFGSRGPNDGPSESIGSPNNIEVKLLNQQNGKLVHGPGVGEILLKGPMLTEGYMGNTRDTNEVWIDGWLHTGDIAERNEEGLYFIRGRLKETVLRGGVQTYLHELEHYVRRSPKVIDAVAFRGREIPSGDELCLTIQTDGQVSQQELFAWIKLHLKKENLPNVMFITRDELPRNSNGKILRTYWEELYKNGTLKPEATKL